MAKQEYRVKVEERRFYVESRKGNYEPVKNVHVQINENFPIPEDHRAHAQVSWDHSRVMGVEIAVPTKTSAAKYMLLMATLAAEIQEWLTLTNAHQDIHVMLHWDLCRDATLDVVFTSTSEYDRRQFANFWDNRPVEFNGRSGIRYNKPEQAEQQEAA